MKVNLYQEKHLERLLVSCPRCGGALVRHVEWREVLKEDDLVDERHASIVCSHCGHNFGTEPTA